MSRPQINLSVCRLEDRWILAAVARVLFGDTGKEGAPPPASAVDWDLLWKISRNHALTACLAAYCAEHPAGIPPAFLDRLRVEQGRVDIYNRCLASELVYLAELFEKEGVRVLAWKGPVLAAAVYPVPSLRMCLDLDILVWPGDLERAVGLLCRHGYTCPDPVPGLHSRNMERQSPGILVELHERVAQAHLSIPLTDASLWKDSGMVRIGGGAVPVASPEMNLLLLCLHGAKHVWQRLSWVCDVLLFVHAHPHLDWERFLNLAKECRSLRIVHSSLLLANEVRSGCVPVEVLDRAASDSGAVSLARKAAGWLLLSKVSYRVSIQKYWFLVCMRDSVRDRLPVMRHLLGMALKPREEDWKSVRLPRSMAFLYYIVRPFRLMRKLMGAR